MARSRETAPRRSKRIAASREGSTAPSEDGDHPVANNAAAAASSSSNSHNTLLREHMTLRRSPPRPAPSPPRSPSPAAAEHTSPLGVTIPVEFTPRPTLLRRALGFLSSPFGAARAPSTPTPQQQQQQQQQPLGALPASRKRAAPEPEPEQEQEPPKMAVPAPQPAITVASATPNRTKTPRGPSTLNRNYPSSLNAISERTENSAPTARGPERTAEPTPSRRTISSVRSKRDQARSTPNLPRAWTRPPMPREPNADNRLAKLNHYHEMKDHVQSLEKDEEIRAMVAGHRTKRVKIDDLVYIPHNRPGDPSSTFRVYDDDSEDEMEVDEDVEIRKNVFEEVTEDPSPSKRVDRQPVVSKQPPQYQQPPAHQQPPQSNQPTEQVVKPRAQQKVQPQPQQAAPTPGELLHAHMQAGKPLEPHQIQVPAEGASWVFPSVSKRTEPYQDGTAQEARLGAIFKMAYDHWMRSGEVLPVF